MRKQLRCSDILYKSLDITIPIKGIERIVIEDDCSVFASYWIIHTMFIDGTTNDIRIDLQLEDKLFIKDLTTYVKDVNKHLKEIQHGSSNKT